MRIGAGYLLQESNTFSPIATVLADFSLREGDAIRERWVGTRTEIGGFFETLGDAAVPLFAGWAITAGPIRAADFEAMKARVAAALRAAGPLDGVLLALHGAMCAEGTGDCDGAILEMVREIAGPACPVAVTLDLHANLTDRMVRAADAIIGYRTYPHVDMFETGEAAAGMLLRTLRGEIRPVTVMRKIPMIVPAENMQTTAGPMADVWVAAAGAPGVLSASVFGVQPWLDVEEMGCSVVAVGNGDRRAAELCACHAARKFWERRHAFEVRLLPPRDAIAVALATEGCPVILAESSDSPTAGSPGDSADMLAALLRHAPGVPAALWLCDPAAVEKVWAAGCGAGLQLALGGAFDVVNRRPVAVRVVVRSLSGGTFVLKGHWNKGMAVAMGRTAVLEAGSISVVVSEKPASMIDPELYRSQGIEPREKKVVVVKSARGFRTDYEPFAAAIIVVDTPGCSSANLRSLAYRRVPRPIYPLDDFQWSPAA